MTTPIAEGTQRGRAPDTGTANEAAAEPGTPGPWDAPWQRKEDATGWETVYRGTGERRPIRSVLEVELTPEQRAWIGPAARGASLTRAEFVSKLIEDARQAAIAAPDETEATG